MKPVANFAICIILCCSKLVASVPFPEDLARYLAAAYGTSALAGLQQQLQPQPAFNPNQNQLNNIQNQFRTSQSYPLLQNSDVTSGALLGLPDQSSSSVQKNFLDQSQVPIFQQQRLSQQPQNIPFQQQNYQRINEPLINEISERRNIYDDSGNAASPTLPDNIIRSIQQIQQRPGYTQQNIDQKILLQNDQTIGRQEPQINVPISQQRIEQPLLNDNIQNLNVPQSLQDPRIQNIMSGTKFKKRFLVIHPDGTINHVDSLESVIKQHPNYILLNADRITEPIHTEEQYPAAQENNIQSQVQTNPEIYQNNQLFRVTEEIDKKEDPVEDNIDQPVHTNNELYESKNPAYGVPSNKNQVDQNKSNNTKFDNHPVYNDTKNNTNPSEQNYIQESPPNNATFAATNQVPTSKISEQVISNPTNSENDEGETISNIAETSVPSKTITPSKEEEVKKENSHTSNVKTAVNDSEPQSIREQQKKVTNLNNDVNIGSTANEPNNDENNGIKPINVTSVDSTKVNNSLNIVPVSSSSTNLNKKSKTTSNNNITNTTNLSNQNDSKNNTNKPHVNKLKPKTIVNNSNKKTPIKKDERNNSKQNNNNKNVVKEKHDSNNPSTKNYKNVKNTEPITKSDNTNSNDEGKQKINDVIKALAHSEYKDKVVILQIVMPPIVDREIHTTVYPNGTIVDEITELMWDGEDEDADPVEVKTVNVRNINDEE